MQVLDVSHFSLNERILQYWFIETSFCSLGFGLGASCSSWYKVCLTWTNCLKSCEWKQQKLKCKTIAFLVSIALHLLCAPLFLLAVQLISLIGPLEVDQTKNNEISYAWFACYCFPPLFYLAVFLNFCRNSQPKRRFGLLFV